MTQSMFTQREDAGADALKREKDVDGHDELCCILLELSLPHKREPRCAILTANPTILAWNAH